MRLNTIVKLTSFNPHVLAERNLRFVAYSYWSYRQTIEYFSAKNCEGQTHLLAMNAWLLHHN